MLEFPKIYVVGNKQVEEGKRYQLWIGRINGKVVYLILSPFNDAFTIGKLMLEIDAHFEKTTAIMDVYIEYERVWAKFWSSEYGRVYDEKRLEPFMNDNTARCWEEAVGVPVSFYPFGGPADKPEKFPNFPRKD